MPMDIVRANLKLALIYTISETFTSIFSLTPLIQEKEDILAGDIREVLLASVKLTGVLEGTLSLIPTQEDACDIVSKIAFFM